MDSTVNDLPGILPSHGGQNVQKAAWSSSPAVAFNTWHANHMVSTTVTSSAPVRKITARSRSPIFSIPGVFRPPPGLDMPIGAECKTVPSTSFEKPRESKFRDTLPNANSELPTSRCDPAPSAAVQAKLTGTEKVLTYGQRRRLKQRQSKKSFRSQSAANTVDSEVDDSVDAEAGPLPVGVVVRAADELEQKQCRLEEGARLAMRVRTFASVQLEEAWGLFQREFHMQQLIWSSLSLVQQWDLSPELYPEVALQSAVEMACNSAAVNILQGAFALKYALKLDADHGGVFNAATHSAALAVIDLGDLVQLRLQLAERLKKPRVDQCVTG